MNTRRTTRSATAVISAMSPSPRKRKSTRTAPIRRSARTRLFEAVKLESSDSESEFEERKSSSRKETNGEPASKKMKMPIPVQKVSDPEDSESSIEMKEEKKEKDSKSPEKDIARSNEKEKDLQSPDKSTTGEKDKNEKEKNKDSKSTDKNNDEEGKNGKDSKSIDKETDDEEERKENDPQRSVTDTDNDVKPSLSDLRKISRKERARKRILRKRTQSDSSSDESCDGDAENALRPRVKQEPKSPGNNSLNTSRPFADITNTPKRSRGPTPKRMRLHPISSDESLERENSLQVPLKNEPRSPANDAMEWSDHDRAESSEAEEPNFVRSVDDNLESDNNSIEDLNTSAEVTDRSSSPVDNTAHRSSSEADSSQSESEEESAVDNTAHRPSNEADSSQSESEEESEEESESEEEPHISGDEGSHLVTEAAQEKFEEERELTEKKLIQFHRSLVKCPNESKLHPNPAGLKIKLMEHQQYALSWLKWRETRPDVRGGLLADDMGLGKTLSMISLVLVTKNPNAAPPPNAGRRGFGRGTIYDGHTLVVCPPSLLQQWEGEVRRYCKKKTLTVYVHYGPQRKRGNKHLANYDIVITTYGLLVQEQKKDTCCFKIYWERVILDEAHFIRNHKGQTAKAVFELKSKFRWALTGTPIHNRAMDLFSLMKFFRASPFDNIRKFRKFIVNGRSLNLQRLLTIMKAIMLRRTKKKLIEEKKIVSIPSKTFEEIEVNLDHEEDLAYQKILLFSQTLFARFLIQRLKKDNANVNMGIQTEWNVLQQLSVGQKQLLERHQEITGEQILIIITRLRQMCCHPAMVHKFLDRHDIEVDDFEDNIQDDISRDHRIVIPDVDDSDEEAEFNLKLDRRISTNLLTKENPVFDDDRKGSKMRAILLKIEDIIAKKEKVVVVSQWTTFLNVIARFLDHMPGADWRRFTGEVPISLRQSVVDEFNSSINGEANILLLSLTTGGVGLNLMGGNHLMLVDNHWNPQLEEQAMDRIYRIGQTKPVFVYRFICVNTIEERIKSIQTKKLQIADTVLTGIQSVSAKLSLEDMKLLFALPPKPVPAPIQPPTELPTEPPAQPPIQPQPQY